MLFSLFAVFIILVVGAAAVEQFHVRTAGKLSACVGCGGMASRCL
jgi:hypothetical protein